MLVVRAIENQPSRGIEKGDEFRLYVVDAHHHMGREKGHKNTPAGAYDFYAQLWFEIQKKTKTLMEDDSLLFEPVRIEAPDLVSRLFQSKAGEWADLVERQDGQEFARRMKALKNGFEQISPGFGGAYRSLYRIVEEL